MSDIFVRFSPRKAGVTRLGVRLFNATWPCSNLDPNRSYWFEFDHDGDLVDTDVPEHSDGAAALALSRDCQEWLMEDTIPQWANV